MGRGEDSVHISLLSVVIWSEGREGEGGREGREGGRERGGEGGNGEGRRQCTCTSIVSSTILSSWSLVRPN